MIDYTRQQTGIVAISMGYGSGDFSGEGECDSDLTTPSGHAGVTFLAATGADGAAAGVEYSSSWPDVVAVGETI